MSAAADSTAATASAASAGSAADSAGSSAAAALTTKQLIELIWIILRIAYRLDTWEQYYVWKETFYYEKDLLERQIECIKDIVYELLLSKATGDDMFVDKTSKIRVQFAQKDIDAARYFSAEMWYLTSKRVVPGTDIWKEETPEDAAKWSRLSRAIHGISNSYATDLPQMEQLMEELSELKMLDTVQIEFGKLRSNIKKLWVKFNLINIFKTPDFVLATAQPLSDEMLHNPELQNKEHYGWLPRLIELLGRISDELYQADADALARTD